MNSPWQRHRHRLQGASASQLTPAALQNHGGYNQMLLMLEQHRRHLKQVQSMQRKAELKRQYLPDYAAWVAGVLQHGRGVQDDVLMYVMLWRIDAGDYDGALDIADYALHYRLAMPKGHERTTGCVVAEEIADAAKRGYSTKTPLPLAVLNRTANLTESQDMPDKVRAELYKWLGYSQRDNNLSQSAYASLLRALDLNNHVGVKKDVEQLDRLLKQLNPTPM